MGTVVFTSPRTLRVLGLQKLLFPCIFCDNDIPERNLITKTVVNSTATIFRGNFTTTNFSLKRVKSNIIMISFLVSLLIHMFKSFSLECGFLFDFRYLFYDQTYLLASMRDKLLPLWLHSHRSAEHYEHILHHGQYGKPWCIVNKYWSPHPHHSSCCMFDTDSNHLCENKSSLILWMSTDLKVLLIIEFWLLTYKYTYCKEGKNTPWFLLFLVLGNNCVKPILL